MLVLGITRAIASLCTSSHHNALSRSSLPTITQSDGTLGQRIAKFRRPGIDVGATLLSGMAQNFHRFGRGRRISLGVELDNLNSWSVVRRGNVNPGHGSNSGTEVVVMARTRVKTAYFKMAIAAV